MFLQKIDHVALNVKDLQRSFDWYQRVFNFQMIHQWNTTWMIGNAEIRLGLFHRPDASTLTAIDMNIIAIQHYAFLADKENFDRAIAHLDALNIPRSDVDDTGIALAVHVTDPDGHPLEITTYY